MLVTVREPEDCATDARTREKTPSVGSASSLTLCGQQLKEGCYCIDSFPVRARMGLRAAEEKRSSAGQSA